MRSSCDVDLEIVEGLHHDEARERYARADIVVDQLNAGWYGIFAIEAMALGKPVVTFLHDEAVVERSEEAFGTASRSCPRRQKRCASALRPLVEDAAERRRLGAACRAYVERVHDIERIADRLLDIYCSPLVALASQLKRLGKHSVDLRARRARLPRPRRTAAPALHALSEPVRLRQGRDARRATTVLTIVLRFGISSAFFRFYFDSRDPAHRTTVVRTSFWFTMTMATAGLAAGILLAPEISHLLFGNGHAANLVRAAFVGLWAQMNYEQLTSLFRVEERSVAFVFASLANVLITVGATVVLVVVLDKGPIGVVVGNFLGTLAVYLALLGYRREQLGLELDRGAAPGDEPLRHAARSLGALPVGDELRRPLHPRQAHRHDRGRPLLGRRAHRVGDGAPADGLPHGLARVRLLDRARRRGEDARTASCSHTSS